MIYEVKVYVKRRIIDKNNKLSSRWCRADMLSGHYNNIKRVIKDIRAFIRIDRKQNSLNKYKYSICVVKKGGAKRG